MSITDITAGTDVNAAFASERTAMVGRIADLMSDEGQARYIAEQTANFEGRVAAGELVRLSEGRYQSTQGWDRGEIWNVTSVDGRSLVIPQHGLDLDEDGNARLYTAVPAWHGLGEVIAGGTSDVAEVIRRGRLDVPAVSVPVPDYQVPGLPGTFKADGKFILANGRTGDFWGVVGKVHKNLSVLESFDFMQSLVEDHGVVFESAGMMGEGRKVFISCQLPAHVTIDAEGIADGIRMYLVVQDTRDGSAAYKAMITPWRPICQNTNRFALRDAAATVSLRHTTGIAGRLEKIRATLGMSVRYVDAFAAEEEVLQRTATTLEEFETTMAELFKAEGVDVFGARDRAQESNRTAGSNDRREEALMTGFRRERARVGSTLYATENTVTDFLDWGKVRKGDGAAARWTARIEASLAGDDDAFKSRAHGRLLELANR
jgi:phage/plasmid-like protein (TIGR03299 family)